MKGRTAGGRQLIQPVEVLAGFQSDNPVKETVENLNLFLDKSGLIYVNITLFLVHCGHFALY